MKFYLVLSLLIGSATARRNPFTVFKRAKQLRFLLSVKDGSFLDGAESLEPTLDWENDTEFGDVTVRYGVKAAATTKEGAVRTAWAKATTETDEGWVITGKGDLDLNDRSSVDLELDILNTELDTSIGIDASLEREGGLDVKFAEIHRKSETNIFDQPGKLDLKARYTFEDSKAEVEIDYESDATSAEMVASADEKSLKLSRRVGDIMPFIRNAKYSVTVSDKEDNKYEYERVIDEDGTLKASFIVNERAEIEWKDNGWVASASSDLVGIKPTSPDIHVKKEVTF
eukprot:CAMPEP_0194165694 /NCGR_PEP_ID=MMETSP0154-20130528/1544_1 /TAXON_ID=1049557 /ORGANISM="Thalassiothrix antarctica, Strain L6-D1" /LENGTH=284 /DNA_ID=CAMNT_0038876201 /DNA_START=73 /DNA_END=927 /DNA_ORIENTATION=-